MQVKMLQKKATAKVSALCRLQLYCKQTSPQVFFGKHYWNLENNIFRRSLRHTSILIKFQLYTAQSVILPKMEFMLDLSEEVLKILLYLLESILGRSFFE